MGSIFKLESTIDQSLAEYSKNETAIAPFFIVEKNSDLMRCKVIKM